NFFEPLQTSASPSCTRTFLSQDIRNPRHARFLRRLAIALLVRQACHEASCREAGRVGCAKYKRRFQRAPPESVPSVGRALRPFFLPAAPDEGVVFAGPKREP